MLFNFRFSIDWLKKKQFLRFWPLSSSCPNSDTTECLPKLYIFTYLVKKNYKVQLRTKNCQKKNRLLPKFRYFKVVSWARKGAKVHLASTYKIFASLKCVPWTWTWVGSTGRPQVPKYFQKDLISDEYLQNYVDLKYWTFF